MSSFEYLSVFVAVIMGLAVTRLLSAVGSSIRHRDGIEGHWVHSLWALNVLLYVVSIWWALFAWNQLPEWNYFLFLFLVLYAIVLYLLTDVLYPDQITEGLNLKSHFIQHRSAFFWLLLAAVLLDIPETVLKARAELRPIPGSYWALHVIWMVIPPVGLATSNHRVHSLLPILFLLSTVGFVLWGILFLTG
jgi:hypothetical protein